MWEEVAMDKASIELDDIVIHQDGPCGVVAEVRYNGAEEVEVDWINDKTRATRVSIKYLARCIRLISLKPIKHA